MPSLLHGVRTLAMANESNMAKAKAAEQLAAAKKAAEEQRAREVEKTARNLTPAQQTKLAMLRAFERSRTSTLPTATPDRAKIERTAALLKRIDAAWQSGTLRRQGIKAILQRK